MAASLLACAVVRADTATNAAGIIQGQLCPMLDSLTQASVSVARQDRATASTQIGLTQSLAGGLLSTVQSPDMVVALGKAGKALQKGIARFQSRLVKAKTLVDKPAVTNSAALKAMLNAMSDGQRLRKLLLAVPASDTVVVLGEVSSSTIALHYSGDVVCFHVDVLNGNSNPSCGSADVSAANLGGDTSDLVVMGSPSILSPTDFCLTMGPDAGTLRVTVTMCGQSSSILIYNYGVPKKKGPALGPPQNLAVATSTSDTIQLAWSSSVDGANGFKIERSETGSDPWTQVGLADNNVTAYVDSGLNESATYFYRARAYNAKGYSGYSNTAGGSTVSETDTTPPSTPSGLNATFVSATEIDLSWDAAIDTGGSGVQDYRIYRDDVLVATRPNTSYSCVDLAPATEYCFTVAADDNGGNTSAQSGPVCTATLNAPSPSLVDGTAPTVPNGVMVATDSATQITAHWNASSDSGGSGLAGYRVYRNGTQVATTAATSCSDSGLSPGTEYCYTVVAYDSAGNSSGVSAQACATTQTAADTTAPSAADGVAGSADSTTQITVHWNGSSDNGGSGMAGYRIYRNGTQVATTAATSYSDSGLSAGTQYCYTIVAYDNAGNSSSASTQACVTTLSNPPAAGSPSADEFVGPFASWADVRADYGAVGDGVHDDTAAFQAAFNELNVSGHSPVLWIPAGTYKLTATVKMLNRQYVGVLGQDPANTILDWQGPSSGPVLWLDSVGESRFGRFTMRGNGAQTLIEQSSDSSGTVFDTGNTYEDLVLTNGVTGFAGGFRNGPGPSAEVSFRRCQFLSLSYIGINLGNANALDYWVWDCTFRNCARGIWTCNTGDAGFHVFRSLFIGSSVTDIKACGKSFFTVAWNTSTGSVSFVQVQSESSPVLLQGNTVIDPQGTAVDVRSLGPVSLIDNTIGSRSVDTSPSVLVSNSAGVDVLSVGNIFTVANALKTYGGAGLTRVISVDDTNLPRASVSLSLPAMPGVASNYNRTVYEVSGTSAAAVQAAINAAAISPRAVVHLPYQHYNIDTTLTVPAHANLWITGDAHNPNLLGWGGAKTVPMWKIIGPTKVVLSDMQLNLYGGTGILCTNVDQVGSRVMIWKSWLYGGSVANLRAQNLVNCRVELQETDHEITRNGDGAEGTSLIVNNAQVFGYALLAASNRTNYWVSNGGKLLLHTSWYEDGGNNLWYSRVFDTSTVTIASGNLADSPWGTGVFGISLTNFNGRATVLNFLSKNDITLEGNSFGTNWIANSCRWNDNGYTVNFSNKSASGTQVVSGSNYHEPTGNREYQVGNVGTVTASFTRSMLQHLRADRPSALTGTIAPSATDILLIRMAPYCGSTDVEIKP